MRLPDAMRNVDDAEWLSMLISSLSGNKINSVEFPLFPVPELQSQFVGSSGEGALKEAFKFYQFVKNTAKNAGNPLCLDQKFLDFGCGWGRYLRFFWKDIYEDNLYGCDVDPLVLDVCRQTKVPGNLSQITPRGKFPYPDAYFHIIIAYSVFTHLPEKTHLHWMEEVARVAAPGCIFCLTLEPRRFIDFVAGLSEDSEIRWHKALAKYAKDAEKYYHLFDSGNIAYLPTGTGSILNDSVYGDAVVPISYIERVWSKYFSIIEYIDDRKQFWQAALAVAKK